MKLISSINISIHTKNDIKSNNFIKLYLLITHFFYSSFKNTFIFTSIIINNYFILINNIQKIYVYYFYNIYKFPVSFVFIILWNLKFLIDGKRKWLIFLNNHLKYI